MTITTPADRMSSLTALTADERARLASRPDWSPVYDRTAESCERLLDELDARVTQMLKGEPCSG